MKTLLNLFLLPRLKNIGFLLTLSFLLLGLTFITKQIKLIALSCFLAFMFITYNLLNSHMVENVEWLKNSAFSNRKLLAYYFLEQSIIFFFVLFALILFSSFLFTFYFLIQEDLGTSILDSFGEGDKTKQVSFLTNHFIPQNFYSSTESALETIMAFFIFFSTIYGAELIKSYFIRLKFEKKFSKENYWYNGLIVVMILFLYLKDTSIFMAILNMKILVIPILVALVSLALIIACNSTFKLFKPKLNSWQMIVPLLLFFTLLLCSIFFAKINYRMNENVDEKIAEHRFLWFFSAPLKQQEQEHFYLTVIHPNNFSYMVERYPYLEQKHFTRVLSNRHSLDELVELTKLWPLENISPDNRKAFLHHLDSIAGKAQSEWLRDKSLIDLYKQNKQFWNSNPQFSDSPNLKIVYKKIADDRKPAGK